MERHLIGLFAAMLVASAGECWSNDGLPYKPISEETVRAVSAQMYSDILRRACLQVLRYPSSQIESGFKRHFQEMRLTLMQEGYTILPNVTENDSSWSLSEMEFDAILRVGLPHQFGCFRAYWLDDSNPDWQSGPAFAIGPLFFVWMASNNISMSAYIQQPAPDTPKPRRSGPALAGTTPATSVRAALLSAAALVSSDGW